MTKESEGILRAQYELHGRIARAYDNLRKSGVANITVGLVEARLQALESNWSKFKANHSRLMTAYWEVLEKHEYVQDDFLATVEETLRSEGFVPGGIAQNQSRSRCHSCCLCCGSVHAIAYPPNDIASDTAAAVFWALPGLALLPGPLQLNHRPRRRYLSGRKTSLSEDVPERRSSVVNKGTCQSPERISPEHGRSSLDTTRKSDFWFVRTSLVFRLCQH